MESFYTAVSRLQTKDEARLFLEDMCSPAELSALEHRFTAARLLKVGKTYQEISRETNISSAIVSRVNNVLQRGNGALRDAVDASPIHGETGS
jgi:TrpR-related protein YerC/YecD